MKITGLKKSYNGKTVLDVSSLELEKGLIYAVIGANGSGKSTMAKLMVGAEKADTKVVFDEKPRIGYIPQKPFAFNMTVDKNVNINGGEDEARKNELLQRLRIDNLRNENAKKLSGGETARMALARLLVKDYDLLILDEPTAAMDVELTLLAESVITDYRDRLGITVVIITHELNEAKRVADVVMYLEDGELVEMGPAAQILNNASNPKTKKYIDFYR